MVFTCQKRPFCLISQIIIDIQKSASTFVCLYETSRAPERIPINSSFFRRVTSYLPLPRPPHLACAMSLTHSRWSTRSCWSSRGEFWPHFIVCRKCANVRGTLIWSDDDWCDQEPWKFGRKRLWMYERWEPQNKSGQWSRDAGLLGICLWTKSALCVFPLYRVETKLNNPSWGACHLIPSHRVEILIINKFCNAPTFLEGALLGKLLLVKCA